jgi:hypothetical protein
MDKANAIKTLAGSVRAHIAELRGESYVHSEPKRHSPSEEEVHLANIAKFASMLDGLADDARSGDISYERVDQIIRQMKAVGFFPDETAVDTVAQAFFTRR